MSQNPTQRSGHLLLHFRVINFTSVGIRGYERRDWRYLGLEVGLEVYSMSYSIKEFAIDIQAMDPVLSFVLSSANS